MEKRDFDAVADALASVRPCISEGPPQCCDVCFHSYEEVVGKWKETVEAVMEALMAIHPYRPNAWLEDSRGLDPQDFLSRCTEGEQGAEP